MAFIKYQTVEKLEPVKKDEIEPTPKGQKPKLSSVKPKA